LQIVFFIDLHTSLPTFYFPGCLTYLLLCSSENGEEDIANGNNDNNNKEDDKKDKVRDNDKDAMPPKEVRSAAATKKPTTTTAMTLPIPRPPLNFSINCTHKLAIAYYCEGTQDYAEFLPTSTE
jgi:hypothetical protein